MELKYSHGSICFEDGNNSFEMYRTVDEDIWFVSKEPNITFTFNGYSRNHEEYMSYQIFARLMREIFGNYILENDDQKNNLPKDFIDLENKLLIWHTDSAGYNTLELLYESYSIGPKTITLALTKAPKEDDNRVRIRTNGSSYQYYYKFFVNFYSEFIQLINNLHQEEYHDSKDSNQKKLR